MKHLCKWSPPPSESRGAGGGQARGCLSATPACSQHPCGNDETCAEPGAGSRWTRGRRGSALVVCACAVTWRRYGAACGGAQRPALRVRTWDGRTGPTLQIRHHDVHHLPCPASHTCGAGPPGRLPWTPSCPGPSVLTPLRHIAVTQSHLVPSLRRTLGTWIAVCPDTPLQPRPPSPLVPSIAPAGRQLAWLMASHLSQPGTQSTEERVGEREGGGDALPKAAECWHGDLAF